MCSVEKVFEVMTEVFGIVTNLSAMQVILYIDASVGTGVAFVIVAVNDYRSSEGKVHSFMPFPSVYSPPKDVGRQEAVTA